jgi:hypothetical protein
MPEALGETMSESCLAPTNEVEVVSSIIVSYTVVFEVTMPYIIAIKPSYKAVTGNTLFFPSLLAAAYSTTCNIVS